MESVPAVSSPVFLNPDHGPCYADSLLSPHLQLSPTPQSLWLCLRPLVLSFYNLPERWVLPVPRSLTFWSWCFPVCIFSLYLHFCYLHVLNSTHLKWNSHAHLQIRALSGAMPPSFVTHWRDLSQVLPSFALIPHPCSLPYPIQSIA